MAEEGLGQGGAPAGGGADSANGSENAFSFLPDGLQSLAEGYGDPSLFWADVSRLKGMDSELKALKGISPDTLATEEDFDKAFTALGRPADKSGYKLPENWEGLVWTPDGPGENAASPEVAAIVNKYLTDSGERQQFADMARRCDLTQKQAEKLFGLYGGLLARHAEAEMAKRAEADPQKVMAQIWPQDTAAHHDTARRGAQALGIGNELDDAGLSGHPLVLKLCHALGERTGEDKLAGLSGGGGAGLPVGQAAQEELRRIVGSEAYKNHDPAAIRKAEALSARVHMK